MTTSQTPFFSELEAGHPGPPIPEAKRVYFQARLRNRLFNYIHEKFAEAQRKGLTQAALARRIEKPPEVINRWLGAPSNLTLDTISDLLLGIAAEELTPASESLLSQRPTDSYHADWFKIAPRPTAETHGIDAEPSSPFKVFKAISNNVQVSA